MYLSSYIPSAIYSGWQVCFKLGRFSLTRTDASIYHISEYVDRRVGRECMEGRKVSAITGNLISAAILSSPEPSHCRIVIYLLLTSTASIIRKQTVYSTLETSMEMAVLNRTQPVMQCQIWNCNVLLKTTTACSFVGIYTVLAFLCDCTVQRM